MEWKTNEAPGFGVCGQAVQRIYYYLTESVTNEDKKYKIIVTTKLVQFYQNERE